MCGRFAQISPVEELVELFEAEPEEGVAAGPRPNVCPTERVPVVVSGGAGRRIVPTRWGFLPSWYRAPNGGPLLINARSETIAAKPAFADAARRRRCLIPADHFYEWQGEKGAAVPHVIRPRGGGIIAFAGVWQDWGNMATCAIVTCAANARLAPIHHRMPVVIGRQDFGLWLGEAGHGAARLMVPAAEDLLEVEPAGAEVRAILARRGGA